MEWLDIAQNTDQWMALRIGRIGGSSIGTIMANYGKAFGNPAHDLAVRLALEKIKGVSHESGYTNAHMERGHEQEPIARALYEERTFCEVTNGGYYIVDDDVGVSPDGLVYDDGIIEIKSVIDSVHYKTIKRNAPDPKYKWQLAFNLQCSEREWIDYIEFCAAFPENKRLFIHRIHRSECQEQFDMINVRLTMFKELVQSTIKTINRIAV